METPIDRLRRLCLTLPDVTEKLSHGEPTFFTKKRVFAMFANNHHNDGHIAAWLPVPPGQQQLLIEDVPGTYFRPPYVGVKGWVGIELAQISEEALEIHLKEAWNIVRR